MSPKQLGPRAPKRHSVPRFVQVSALYLYPVKSFRGVACAAAEVVRRGFAHDRRWMLVDGRGVFVSQRERPEMARVDVVFDGRSIALRAPGSSELVLPVELESGQRRRVRVWKSKVEAAVFEPARAWIESTFGFRGDLVYLPDDVERPVDASRAGPGHITSFADAYPFLALGLASLDDLRQRVEVPLEVHRFRPNIVVSGSAPYDEDTWARVLIGGIEFQGAKRCDRCAITTLDPRTGERGVEPLRTLARYREKNGKVWFGMNLVHAGTGQLHVGSTVEVLLRRPPDP